MKLSNNIIIAPNSSSSLGSLLGLSSVSICFPISMAPSPIDIINNNRITI